MRLSRKGTYALRVLVHLAEAYGGEPLSSANLADREGISPKYLEQILVTLKNQGIVVSHRGQQGGYTLRKPPDQVTLGQVIRAVDGPLAPLPCASRTQPTPCEPTDCPFEYETCWLRLVMLRVRDNISDILDRETLADMSRTARTSTRRD